MIAGNAHESTDHTLRPYCIDPDADAASPLTRFAWQYEPVFTWRRAKRAANRLANAGDHPYVFTSSDTNRSRSSGER